MNDIDNEMDSVVKELKKLYPKTGRIHIVGVAGPPGAEKNTQTGQMIRVSKKESKTVGGIAGDPSSLFSGGPALMITLQTRPSPQRPIFKNCVQANRLPNAKIQDFHPIYGKIPS